MPSKANQLRALIYGEPLDQFPPGYPSQRDCMRLYMWCVDQQRAAENNAIKLNDKSKQKIRDNFVKLLEVHWSNQPEPKSLMDTKDIRRLVKPLIDFYWKLQDLGSKLEEPDWINDRRTELEILLDIEKKISVPVSEEKRESKKRSFQEVRKKKIVKMKCLKCKQNTLFEIFIFGPKIQL